MSTWNLQYKHEKTFEMLYDNPLKNYDEQSKMFKFAFQLYS